MRKRVFSSIINSVLVAAMCIAAGCASPRDPINRVQPNYVDKKEFGGLWYYQRTVVDMPAANGFTFIGATDTKGLTRVAWDIQEGFLYARRTTELIKDADGHHEAQKDGNIYKGEVVAAFRIQKHFDIARPYNDVTGEELNVLVENDVDRHWYDRRYMRVDWSQNLVHNYDLDFERESIESVPYYVQEIDPVTGKRNPDAPAFDFEAGYFDVTTKLFAKAGTTEYPGIGQIPLCWLDELIECGAAEYTLRHSFKKLDGQVQYQPREYKGKQTEMFGYFWTDRLVYNPKTGLLENARERYLNRFNIWKRSFDDNGDPIPYVDREPKPVVYHVNTNWPKDDEALNQAATTVADQWNEVLVDVVKATGNTLLGNKRMFVLCRNNPVEAGDPEECGEPGTEPKLGDLRYSFMAYVPKYMTYGLLGFGPSNVDPETGEIISGMVYVYHHNNISAFRVQEMVELLNGTMPPTDYIDGLNLDDWVQRTWSGGNQKRTYGLNSAGDMVYGMTHGPAVSYWDGIRQAPTAADMEYQKKHGMREWMRPYLRDLNDRRIGLRADMDGSQGKLANLRDTEVEYMLLNDDILAGSGVNPLMPYNGQLKAQASVARGGFGRFAAQREQIRQQFARKRNMFLPEMADDSLLGLAFDLKDENLSADEMYATLREAVYRNVLSHELGHTLGLKHNFSGSEDAINYHDDYWKIRETASAGPVMPRVHPDVNDGNYTIGEEEVHAGIYDYAYSSVMDYAGRHTLHDSGPGKYDRAALLFGYVGKVEVFADQGGIANADFRDWHEMDGEVVRFAESGPQSIHYTSFYNSMGEKLYKESNRVLVDVDDLTDDFSEDEDGRPRVPYLYCSDSRVDLYDHCLTRDVGADSAERMKNLLDEIDTWYITRNFPRGQIDNKQSNFIARNYNRIYARLKHWNDKYALYKELLPRFYDSDQLETFFNDSSLGWGTKTWSVQNAFNRLVQTILMPDVGAYKEETLFEGSSLLTQDINVSAEPDYELGVEDARFFSTSWESDAVDCGYYWWECLHHVGFYLDKIMAIEALTDTSTNFVARTTPEDIRQWRIGYYNTFPEQISIIGAAIASNGRLTNKPIDPNDASRSDWNILGPYIEIDDQNNQTMRFPNYTNLHYNKESYGSYSDTVPAINERSLDPHASFSVQLYWQVLGMARFASTFEHGFADQSRIWLIGSNSPDARFMTGYTDPITSQVYGALKRSTMVASSYYCLKTEKNFPENNCPKFAGQAIIDRANELRAWSHYCDDSGKATETEDDDCVYSILYPPYPDTEAEIAEMNRLKNLATPKLLEMNELIKTLTMVGNKLDWGNPHNPHNGEDPVNP